MKKPTYNFCCCCCDLKIGSCILVGFELLASFFGIIALIAISNEDRRNTEYSHIQQYPYNSSLEVPPWIAPVSCIGFAINFITSILFFSGVCSKKPKLLLPYIIKQVVYLVLGAVGVLLSTITLFMEAGIIAFIFLIASSISIMIAVYLVACVYSFYIIMQYPQTPNPGLILPWQMAYNNQQQIVTYPYPIAPNSLPLGLYSPNSTPTDSDPQKPYIPRPYPQYSNIPINNSNSLYAPSSTAPMMEENM